MQDNRTKEAYIRLINSTEDYINSHLSEKILLDNLADNVHLSKFHFHRIFSQFSEETIKQFVMRIKMERSAIFMLVRKDIQITEIAQMYGYSDSSSYTKSFKQHFGMTPTAYRIARKDNL